MQFAFSKFIDAEQAKRVELPPNVRRSYSDYYAEKFVESGYKRDPQNAKEFDGLMRYCSAWLGSNRHEASRPKKGLLIKGSRGTGKSAFIQRFSALFEIPYISVSEMTKAYAIGDEKAFWSIVDEHKYENLIVDDLGNESRNKKFGNTMPMADFIEARYEAFMHDGVFTFFTSNAVDEKEIALQYGDWILSRINEMCFIITLNGNDRRLK